MSDFTNASLRPSAPTAASCQVCYWQPGVSGRMMARWSAGAYNGSFHLSEMRAELPSHAGEKPWAPARPVQLHWLRSRGTHLVWQIRLHALAGFRSEAPDKRAFVSGAHCTDIKMAFALIIRGLYNVTRRPKPRPTST